MPKFADKTEEEPNPKPAMDEIPPATKGTASLINQSAPYNSSFGYTPPVYQQQVSTEAQIAKIKLEKEQWKKEFSKQEETWMKTYWRPSMAWLYMAICAFDFIIGPVISMFIPLWLKGTTYVPWKSITLDNGGLIHLAFGAILGITAWTRGLEKIATINK